MSQVGVLILCLAAVLALVGWRVNRLRVIQGAGHIRLSFMGRLAALLAIVSFIWPTYIYFPLPGGPSVNPYTILALAATVFMTSTFAKLLLGFFARGKISHIRDSVSFLAISICVWKLAYSIVFYSEMGNRGFVDVVTVAIPLVLIVTSPNIGLEFRTTYKLLFGVTAAVILFALSDLVSQAVTLQPLATALLSDNQSDAAIIVEQLASDKYRGAGLRLQSLMTHPIILGEFCAMMIPFLLAAYVHPSMKATAKLKVAFAIALLMMIIAGTDSRSGLIVGPAVAGLFYLLLKSRVFATPKLAFFVIGSAAAITAALLLGGIVDLLVTGRTEVESSSSVSRLIMLAVGWEKLLASPIVGYGPGNVGTIVGIQGAGGVYSLDNLFLVLSLGWGLPVAVAQYALIVVLLSRCFKAALTPKAIGVDHLLAASAVCIIVCYLLTSLIVGIDDLLLFTVWIAVCATSRHARTTSPHLVSHLVARRHAASTHSSDRR